MKKKLVVSLASAVVVMTAGTLIAINQPTKKPASIIKSEEASIVSKQTPTTQADQTQQPATTQPVTTAAPQNQPASTQTPSTPYGADPSNPGSYIVIDYQTVMNEAGIPVDQQPAAQSLIASASNWTYNNPSGVNLCLVKPAVKMSVSGADYATNPVTQLKYCNSHYNGNWQQALDYWNTNHTLL